jgi:hypothetical protein
MRNTALAVTLILTISFQLAILNLVTANPSIPPDIPVVVTVSDIQISAEISQINGVYARVNSSYPTSTVYKFGDTYNNGTIGIAYNRIDAYYPIPVDSKNVQVQINGQDLNWTDRHRVFTHLFDSDLPNINWSISPVPQTFLLSTHYEFNVPKTSQANAYLGTYACLIPIESRYGLDTIRGNYSGYSWVGWSTNSSAHVRIKIDSSLSNTHLYSINNLGTLTELKFQLSSDNIAETEMQLTGSTRPFGLVLTFDKPQESPLLSALPILIALMVITLLAVFGYLLIFRRHQKNDKQQTLTGLSQETLRNILLMLSQ